ncbi:MAG TPA: S24/S26 family peptidase [Silvibacterium sp.]|nr:S24/S26 family peptidase [Silvibacterium sp.]
MARRFGEVRFRATGASMMPAIWPGDVLTVRQCGQPDLQLGQIVLYRRQEKLVAHRIVRIQGELITTRGDSVRHDDTPVLESDLIGQVISLARRGRSVPFHLSFWSRAGSVILRRSNFCLRAAMVVARHWQDSESEEISWA